MLADLFGEHYLYFVYLLSLGGISLFKTSHLLFRMIIYHSILFNMHFT